MAIDSHIQLFLSFVGRERFQVYFIMENAVKILAFIFNQRQVVQEVFLISQEGPFLDDRELPGLPDTDYSV
jgi:hypothetical protein